MDDRVTETGQDVKDAASGLVGTTHEILCIRGATTDQGDGGVILGFEMPGSEIPQEYAASASNTMWRVGIREANREDVAFDAVRMTTKDMKKGQATIRLGALAGDIPSGELFGRKGATIVLSIAMTVGEGRPVNIDRGDRLRVLKSIFAHCREPEFLEWLESEARRRRLPVQGWAGTARTGAEHEPTTEDLTAEYVYLLAQIHSREEIIENASAANAVEELLRAYRSAMWHRRR